MWLSVKVDDILIYHVSKRRSIHSKQVSADFLNLSISCGKSMRYIKGVTLCNARDNHSYITPYAAINTRDILWWSLRNYKREDMTLHFARTLLAAHVWSKIFTSPRGGGRLKLDNPTGDYTVVRNAFLFNATRIFNERHLDDVAGRRCQSPTTRATSGRRIIAILLT